jgi:lipopolysaccharide/colanic/teichoic acid biosynthesis glycosyltransferase
MTVAHCKRCVDLVLAGLGLVAALPVCAIISLLIWLDDPGGVLFAQARLGLHGQPFRLLKFRKFAAQCSDAGPGVTVAGDARMTSVGGILERTKLDELPQLWNILKGEMSFVGPRPESLRFADLYQGDYRHLLEFLPGLFGPCQIAFRNESALYPPDEDPEAFYRRVLFPQKAELDLNYFAKATCLGDMRWIAHGLWVTLAGAVNWRDLSKTHGKTLAADLAISLLSWLVATVLRFAGLPTGEDYPAFLLGLWVFPPIVVAGLALGGCYRGVGEGYFSFFDARRLAYAATVAAGVAFLVLLALGSRTLSFYLLPIIWLVLLSGLALPRVWRRSRRERTSQRDNAPPVFVHGAQSGDVALANWLIHGQGRKVVAFFDAAMPHGGRQLMGLPVVSRPGDLLTLQAEHGAREVWMNRPLDAARQSHLAALCQAQGLRLVTLPDLDALTRTVTPP